MNFCRRFPVRRAATPDTNPRAGGRLPDSGARKTILPWFTVSWFTATLLFAVTPAFAADNATLWRWSLVTMAGANVADAVTSLKCNSNPALHETNPVFGPRFTPRDAGLKAGFVGSQAVVQYVLVRKHPRMARWLTVINVGQSIVPVWAAQHNARLGR